MVKLSASRVKTLFNCGILYYNQYVTKIPQGPNNSGAARGSTCHYVLECLLRPDRKERVSAILKKGDPWTDEAIRRLAKIHADKLEVGDSINFEMIRKFILVALQTDFYCEGSTSLEAEGQFDIKTDSYHIGGFLDKRAVYEDKVKIIDYKSSKAKFTGKDHTFNLQNYFYTLAEKKRLQEEGLDLPVEMEFQFLKFAKAPIQTAPAISDTALVGFEEWLGEVTKFIDTLTLTEAMGLAARGSYERGWLCGKGPGEFNVKGEPAFYCQFKFPFVYFELMEGDKVIKSSRVKSELKEIKTKDQTIRQKKYAGCPKWKELWKKPEN